ncbi:MAG: hypothetical protein IK056_07085, partial [Clostridia bacterium]|nr:hypothetical protein [Clostridia bacterium]
LRLRCAEMCCVMSTAPIRLPSSLLGVYEELDASESFDAGGREIGALTGSNSEVVEHYSGHAAKAMADTRALLDKYADGQTDGVFAQSAEYWKSALDGTVNSAYKAAEKSTKPLIATWSLELNMLCDADEELYTQLYFTDPAVAKEHIMDLYREAALLLAEAE